MVEERKPVDFVFGEDLAVADCSGRLAGQGASLGRADGLVLVDVLHHYFVVGGLDGGRPP